jgi:C1A family cysteine protease
MKNLPEHVDLRRQCPPIYNQGLLNSCSAHALGAAVWFEALKRDLKPALRPSRLFLYYIERSIERHPRCNVPVCLRDGHKALQRFGVCKESQWRYVIGKFSIRPPQKCFQAAAAVQLTQYARVKRDLRHLKACLASGNAITMGMSVYESFESRRVKRTGVVPMPEPQERLLGGHAVLVVGYRNKSQSFIVRNSWGPKWGRRGYCFLPYEYLMSRQRYAWDFWTIQGLAVTRPPPLDRDTSGIG